MTKHVSKVERVGQPCKCGCGNIVDQPPGSGRPRQWIEGHKRRPVQLIRLCKCGCNGVVTRQNPRGKMPLYLPGHAPSIRSGA